MATLEEESNPNNDEIAKKSGIIACEGLYDFVIKKFTAFAESVKSPNIDRGTIEQQHRTGRPAFKNSPDESFQNKDAFQICKCYMPTGNVNIRFMKEVDFFTLITVIHNFKPLGEKLSKEICSKLSKMAKKIKERKLLVTDRALWKYVNRIVQLLEEVEAVEKDENISTARKELEKIKDDVETRSYTEQWDICINGGDTDKAKVLLEKGLLPDKIQLNRASDKFGLKSPIIMNICSHIEQTITAASDYIIYTEACCRKTDQSKIVFAVFTIGPIDDIDAAVERYSVIVRSFDYCSCEGNDVINREMQEGMEFDGAELEEIEQILKTESPKLMEKHSNLTLTTTSNYKSTHYSNCLTQNRLIQKTCIVFYVTVKGLIPVGEDLLPDKLGKFDTDVREGRFTFAVGGPPTAKHQNLKIGCQISCKDGSGTIGGFVQHPDHGVCALTCAHVVLSKEEMLSFKMNEPSFSRDKPCYQPEYKEDGEDKCGEVKFVQMHEYNANKAGVDVALVKIDKERLPTTGDFPDCNRSHCKDDILNMKLSFESGVVLDTDKSPYTYTRHVVKYGKTTKLTIGRLRKGGSVRVEFHHDRNKEKRQQKGKHKNKYTFLFHNLLQVNGVNTNFAEYGDSGSLVFSLEEDNKLSAIGIVESASSFQNITFVQPIYSVLEEIGLQKPFSMMKFDPVADA